MAKTTLDDAHHVSRHAKYKHLLRDQNDKPVGLMPQAFEMREKDKGKLSVNWLEYHEDSHTVNIQKAIADIGSIRRISNSDVFGIANIGNLREKSAAIGHDKIKLVHMSRRTGEKNPSHASIVKMPRNDDRQMQVLGSEIFTELVSSQGNPV